MMPNTPDNPPAPDAAPAAPLPEPVAAPMVPAPPVRGRNALEILRLLAERQPEQFHTELKALIEAEMARDLFEQDGRLARMFALSGQFSDIKGNTMEEAIATAMAKIQMGRAYGLNPADSIQFVYFVNGRPALMQEVVAAKMRSAGYSWDIDWMEEVAQHKGKPWNRCIGCTVWLKKFNSKEAKWQPVLDRHGQPVSESFTEGDADHAKVYEKGNWVLLSEKKNFQSWPRDMYFWRAFSRLRKYHVTDVLRGVIMREEAEELPPAPIESRVEVLGAPPKGPGTAMREQILASAETHKASDDADE